MADGRVNKCKECNKKDVRENRSKRVDYYREYDDKRFKNDKARRRSVSARSKEWRERFPDRYKAHYAVTNAVRDGRLTRPKRCENCGKEKGLHGHHDDYSKPLDVMWLCPPCHSLRHKELNHA